MSELPNLREVPGEYRIFLDMDGTLAPSNAFPKLYDALGKLEQLTQERDAQRDWSRRVADEQRTLVVPPYDIFEHLGPNPSEPYRVKTPYNLSKDEVFDLARRVKEEMDEPPLYPDAIRLLGNLAAREEIAPPTILTYGDSDTQELKWRLNGLDRYPLRVVRVLKPDYLKEIEGPGILIDDRPKHLPKPGGGITGVLYVRPDKRLPEYGGLVIRSHDELWRD